MENRLRRCNLRFVGLPEGLEGPDPPSFLENLLVNTFGRAEFSTSFVVERTHRLAPKPLPQGAPPRTFIAKMLNFRDRDAVLWLTRLKGNIPFKNSEIKVFPDFSAEVQKRELTSRKLRPRSLLNTPDHKRLVRIVVYALLHSRDLRGA